MKTIKKTQKSLNKEVINLLIMRGIILDDNVTDSKRQAYEQKKRKKAYHNTKLLLKQYRNISWLIQNFSSEVQEELETPFDNFDDMIDRLDLSIAMGNKHIENKISNLERCRRIIEQVNSAVSILKEVPVNGESLYQIIYLAYIGPESLRVDDILNRMGMAPATYYRYQEQAISIISMKLWATPNGKELSLWLDIVTALEE